jgi:hypothetical protein
MRVINPVREMLQNAGAMEKIREQDIFMGPSEAILAYLTSQYEGAMIEELLQCGADEIHRLLQASLASAPPERRGALAAIAASVSRGIKSEPNGPEVAD